MNINVDLLQWSINVFNKKTSGSGIKNEKISNKEIAGELHKTIIRKLKTRKAHSHFYRNYLGCWSFLYAINK